MSHDMWRFNVHVLPCHSRCGTLDFFFTRNADSTSSSLKPDGCTHHHKNKKNFVGKGKAAEGLKYSLFTRTYAYLMQANLLWMSIGHLISQLQSLRRLGPGFRVGKNLRLTTSRKLVFWPVSLRCLELLFS